jgi:BirA family transcriptional regulator, biotin operon repressor / biotin---[acetyl-CoA-carboxylase] ligase
MIDDFFEAPRDPDFPPLFQAHALSGSLDPFNKACAMAALGCDSGVLVHSITANHLRAAIVFAPEVPLGEAMAVFCACACGLQNAFGALAPPEVALHLSWGGDILVNGAKAGFLQVAASTHDPAAVPDWLVVGLEVRLIPQDEGEPGNSPDETCLFLEGCAEISPLELLEGWARHTLVWVNGLTTGERRALHAEWRELLYGVGGEVTQLVKARPVSGTFLGADADFAMLLRNGDDTRLIPLSALLTKGKST